MLKACSRKPPNGPSRTCRSAPARRTKHELSINVDWTTALTLLDAYAPWGTVFQRQACRGPFSAVRWTPEAAKISPESTRRDEQLPSRALTAARSSSPLSGLVRWLVVRKGAKRHPGCSSVPAEAGVRASDAASGSETRRPHRRRPPGERPAVGTMTSIDETAAASALATCARATRQVAYDKETWLFGARQSRLRSHVQLPTPNQHVTRP